jgi:DNA-binding transcriptional ArsR family regulator
MKEEAAKRLLRELTSQRIREDLTDAEAAVLQAAAKQRRFTNSSLASATRKSKQNVTKYMRRLQKLNYIHLSEKRGRSVFYEVSPELVVLHLD